MTNTIKNAVELADRHCHDIRHNMTKQVQVSTDRLHKQRYSRQCWDCPGKNMRHKELLWLSENSGCIQSASLRSTETAPPSGRPACCFLACSWWHLRSWHQWGPSQPQCWRGPLVSLPGSAWHLWGTIVGQMRSQRHQPTVFTPMQVQSIQVCFVTSSFPAY